MPAKSKSDLTSRESSATAYESAVPLISNEKLLQLYATMVKCRVLEERLCLFAPQGKANRVSEGGQEASLVGATIDLVRGDAILPLKVKLLADWAKGVSARVLPKFVAGVAGHSIRRRSAAALFETTLRASRIRKGKRNRRIVVAFAEVEETVLPAWRRSLAWAVKQKLPIVFVVQVQRLSETVNDQGPAGIEDERQLSAVAGLPAIVVDGDDAVAVYRVAYEAIARARRGSGPTLIECRPYIVRAQADGRTVQPRRRNPAEPWRAADPIVNMETYLRRKGLFTPQARLRIGTAFAAELEAQARVTRGTVARQPTL